MSELEQFKSRVNGISFALAKESWAPLLLLGLVACCALVAAYFIIYAERSPFVEGSIQQHAQEKQRDEVARRFTEGVMMLHAKQYEHALTAFHRVLELDPQMPEAHVNAGYALLGMKRFEAAADFFDTATNLRPDQMNAYYGLGEALMALGNNQGALQAMEAYLHRSPPDDPFRRKAQSAVWELRAAAEAAGKSSPLSGLEKPADAER